MLEHELLAVTHVQENEERVIQKNSREMVGDRTFYYLQGYLS